MCWTLLFIVLVLFVCSCSVYMHTLKFFPEYQLHWVAQAYSTENFFSHYWLLQISLYYCLVSCCESIKFHCNSKSVLFPWYTFKTKIISVVLGNSYPELLKKSVIIKMINTDNGGGGNVKLEKPYSACLRLKVSWKIGKQIEEPASNTLHSPGLIEVDSVIWKVVMTCLELVNCFYHWLFDMEANLLVRWHEKYWLYSFCNWFYYRVLSGGRHHINSSLRFCCLFTFCYNHIY